MSILLDDIVFGFRGSINPPSPPPPTTPSITQIDEFPVNEAVALQLSGLQAQVLWGDFDPRLLSRYNEVEQYLTERIVKGNRSNTREDWKQAIAEAHKVCMTIH